jgi:hypothetical protein
VLPAIYLKSGRTVKHIKYEFSASLDVAGMRRDIKIVREGEISFVDH